MGESLLVVRLGALGDLVHAVPAVAALRRGRPGARIDWLVDARYAAFLEFVPGLDAVIVVRAALTGTTERAGRMERRFAGGAGTIDAARALRQQRYDAAIDAQGLLKSAVWARMSGATRIVGFSAGHARERAAAFLYTERISPPAGRHVVDQNLALAAAFGVDTTIRTANLVIPESPVVAEVRSSLVCGDSGRYAIINPGAGWPNKRWPPGRFAAVAVHLRDAHGLRSAVTWGPGERDLADSVAAQSGGAAVTAPATGLGDLLALARGASLFVSGDTGPLQLAAAAGTPIVGIFGPTSPARNGPWAERDICVSEFDRCECHHKRRCRRAGPCLNDIGVSDVTGAVDRRLALEARRG